MSDLSANEEQPLGPGDVSVATLYRFVARQQQRGVPSTPLADRAPLADRHIYELEERVVELEMRLRERTESAQIHDLELRTMQLDLSLKERYISSLEALRSSLEAELMRSRDERGALDARRAEAEAEVERLGQELVELGNLVQTIHRRRAYRVANAVVGLFRPARAILRRVRRPRRP